MLINKSYFYNNKKWRRKRIEVLENNFVGCELCHSFERLEIHHVIPIPWDINDQVEVNSIWDLIDVPLKVLCHKCHGTMEKGSKGLNIEEVFINGF